MSLLESMKNSTISRGNTQPNILQLLSLIKGDKKQIAKMLDNMLVSNPDAKILWEQLLTLCGGKSKQDLLTLLEKTCVERNIDYDNIKNLL